MAAEFSPLIITANLLARQSELVNAFRTTLAG
jgi:hypothetical protein